MTTPFKVQVAPVDVPPFILVAGGVKVRVWPEPIHGGEVSVPVMVGLSFTVIVAVVAEVVVPQALIAL
jgi:hypothetical protein